VNKILKTMKKRSVTRTPKFVTAPNEEEGLTNLIEQLELAKGVEKSYPTALTEEDPQPIPQTALIADYQSQIDQLEAGKQAAQQISDEINNIKTVANEKKQNLIVQVATIDTLIRGTPVDTSAKLKNLILSQNGLLAQKDLLDKILTLLKEGASLDRAYYELAPQYGQPSGPEPPAPTAPTVGAAATTTPAAAPPPAGPGRQATLAEIQSVVSRASRRTPSAKVTTIDGRTGTIGTPQGGVVQFDLDRLINSGELAFRGVVIQPQDITLGLLALLFESSPNPNSFTADDAVEFINILHGCGKRLVGISDKKSAMISVLTAAGVQPPHLAGFGVELPVIKKGKKQASKTPEGESKKKGKKAKVEKTSEGESKTPEGESKTPEGDSDEEDATDMLHRLEVLFGSIAAGNDGKQITKEAWHILDKLLSLGEINKKQHSALARSYLL
jgi:hypothetical protein